MKILIAFYSRTGTTKKLAEKLAPILNAETEEIIDLKKKKGALGYVICGRDAMMKKQTQIKETVENPINYELVIVGGPVWAGSVSPAVRTFLEKNRDNFKKIAFFCTMGGDNPEKIFSQMEEAINIKPLSVIGIKTKEVINNSDGEKIESFIKSLT